MGNLKCYRIHFHSAILIGSPAVFNGIEERLDINIWIVVLKIGYVLIQSTVCIVLTRRSSPWFYIAYVWVIVGLIWFSGLAPIWIVLLCLVFGIAVLVHIGEKST